MQPVQMLVALHLVPVMVMTGTHLDNVIFIIISKTLMHPSCNRAKMSFIIGGNFCAPQQLFHLKDLLNLGVVRKSFPHQMVLQC